MSYKSFFLFLISALCSVLSLTAQPVFQKGVNVTEWFQSSSVKNLPFNAFTPKDLASLKALGCDVVRFPLNMDAYCGPAPDYRVDPAFFTLLDAAVDMIEKTGMHVILDNHSQHPDQSIRKDLEAFEPVLWAQMAAHFAQRSNLILYEIFNEPHDVTPEAWGRIQGKAIEAIRKVDTVHPIVVGGSDWNSIPGMRALPRYEDKNLIYTFHFYDPMVFTHQGAGWTALKDLKAIPFPPRGSVPTVPADVPAWQVKDLKKYFDGDPVADMKKSLDLAADFAKERGVRIYCGEYGVYNRFSDPSDRVAWYKTVRTLLEERKIPWTTWDCRSTFGLFVKDSAEDFDHDLNLPLVEALGFKPIPQTPVDPAVTEKPVVLYQEGWTGGFKTYTYGKFDTIDFYDKTNPQAGKFCLKFSGLGRYSAAVCDLKPARTWAKLAKTGVLVFWVKGSDPKTKFDVRFIDGDKEGLPWRMSFTVDAAVAPLDGKWHQVQVPLKSMAETGAWDGTWHPAEPGKFRWNDVVRFEVASEPADLTGVTFWMDGIEVKE